jgi:Ni,Fe-hydrogenase maturation factor
MQTKTIFIFGNPELEMDSLPLRILSELQKAFPSIDFEIKDPNEEWVVPEKLTIIDTAVGLKKVTVFDDLESFDTSPHLSMHDFDALANLRYLKKLGKLKKVTIIGVPPTLDESEAIKSVSKILKGLVIRD